MIPLDPAEVLAIRRDPRRRIEVSATDQDMLGMILEGNGHNGVHHFFWIAVVFADNHQEVSSEESPKKKKKKRKEDLSETLLSFLMKVDFFKD